MAAKNASGIAQKIITDLLIEAAKRWGPDLIAFVINKSDHIISRKNAHLREYAEHKSRLSRDAGERGAWQEISQLLEKSGREMKDEVRALKLRAGELAEKASREIADAIEVQGDELKVVKPIDWSVLKG